MRLLGQQLGVIGRQRAEERLERRLPAARLALGGGERGIVVADPGGADAVGEGASVRADREGRGGRVVHLRDAVVDPLAEQARLLRGGEHGLDPVLGQPVGVDAGIGHGGRGRAQDGAVAVEREARPVVDRVLDRLQPAADRERDDELLGAGRVGVRPALGQVDARAGAERAAGERERERSGEEEEELRGAHVPLTSAGRRKVPARVPGIVRI
ncbi:MAG: hypothetical protein R3C15_09265 [Thermoleophilia bacterium]